MYSEAVFIIAWRGLAALLILVRGQCEGLTAGMGGKVETPMPFLFPYLFIYIGASAGENWLMVKYGQNK